MLQYFRTGGILLFMTPTKDIIQIMKIINKNNLMTLIKPVTITLDDTILANPEINELIGLDLWTFQDLTNSGEASQQLMEIDKKLLTFKPINDVAVAVYLAMNIFKHFYKTDDNTFLPITPVTLEDTIMGKVKLTDNLFITQKIKYAKIVKENGEIKLSTIIKLEFDDDKITDYCPPKNAKFNSDITEKQLNVIYFSQDRIPKEIQHEITNHNIIYLNEPYDLKKSKKILDKIKNIGAVFGCKISNCLLLLQPIIDQLKIPLFKLENKIFFDSNLIPIFNSENGTITLTNDLYYVNETKESKSIENIRKLFPKVKIINESNISSSSSGAYMFENSRSGNYSKLATINENTLVNSIKYDAI